MPKESSLLRSLRCHNKSEHLSNPTRANFIIPEKYNHLILHDSGVDDAERFIVLGDKDLLLELKGDTIYGDGTFDKVPQMFYQLYIHSTRKLETRILPVCTFYYKGKIQRHTLECTRQ